MKIKKKTVQGSMPTARDRDLLRVLPDTLLEVSTDGDVLELIPARNAQPPFVRLHRDGGNLRDFLPPQICSAALSAIRLVLDGKLVRPFEFQLPSDSEPRGYEMRITACSETSALLILRNTSSSQRLAYDDENLIHELEVKNQESETLRESLAGIVGSLEFFEIIEKILDQIKRVVPYDSASIWRIDGRDQKLIAGRNLPAELLIGGYTFEIDDDNAVLPILRGDVSYLLKLDVQNQMKDFQIPPHNYIHSWLAIPLKARGEVFGVIALDGREKNQFTHHHADLAVIFADQVAIVLENSRLFADLQSELLERQRAEQALIEEEQRYRLLYETAKKQAQELALIGRVRNAMAQSIDRHGLLFNVVESIAASFGYTQVSLYLLKDEMLVMQHQVGYETPYTTIALDEGVIGKVARTGVPTFLEDVSTSPLYRQAVEGVFSEICIPLFDKGILVGILNVESTQGVKLTEADFKLISTLGEHIGIALENSRLFSDVQTELTERTLAEVNLRQRESVLEAVMFAAEQFLTSANWREVIEVVLQRLGMAMNTTQAYLFENFTGPDGLERAMLFREWTAPGYPTATEYELYAEAHIIQVLPGSANEYLQRGEAYAGNLNTYSPVDKLRLEAIGIKAHAEVPLMVEGRWWGTIGFDVYDNVREWTHFEVDALRVAANLLSNAIRRQRHEQALQKELGERKQIEARLRQRESILEAVADAANLFLKSTNWRDEINGVLKSLGQTIDATHAYLFEDHLGPNGEPLTSMRFEWTAPGYPSDLADNRYQNSPVHQEGFEEQVEALSKGEARMGNLSTFNPIEKQIMQEDGIKALLEVPVFVGGKEWGAIGFNDFSKEREWNPAEVDALMIAANILGAAIKRQQDEHALQVELHDRKQMTSDLQKREAILEVVADAANLFLKSTDWRNEIDDVLEKIGATINASHVFVFENHELSDGHIVSSMQFEWTAPSLTSDLHDPVYQNIPVKEIDFEEWYENMLAGLPYIGDVKRLSKRQMNSLLERGMKALLDFPVFVDGKWWGTIGFDDTNFEREWTNTEVDALQVAGNVLGTAIKRQLDEAALQHELHQRRKLIGELESKNAELERFTYTVSHDLKSPLFTIRGFLGYLRQDALSGNTERLEADIQRIVDATDKMQQLLNDLLELSRVGRLMNEPALVNMQQLVSDVLNLSHGQIHHRGAEVRVQDNLPNVQGDRQRIFEVVQNLVSNATKFMGEQPNPIIEIGASGWQHGMPVLFVRDNGVGIESEHHERIFGLFNKLDPKSDGTGIGLALVKRIVEFHGGNIWVESQPGNGATFYFTLPAQGITDSDYNQLSHPEEDSP
ncbi:MAG TPA: GAF domain-containing protein [Anaerolineales bacterium]|nr:GAF domain-containing protein [Anaerolineales bacterium]HMS01067.1 GAF domain-containing protein [Anaerolineales bacterium]HNQ94521.1 GAF domain-containing protein [Anaerolineales bacterium]HNS60054.1 GAF domain-containing protein [Anaerolineales bacterium]